MKTIDFLDIITTDHLAAYLTAEWGHDLAVFADGRVEIIESAIGFTSDAAPVSRVRCPGIGNLDSSTFTEGFVSWDDEEGAYVVTAKYRDDRGTVVGQLADVIRDCCKFGDVSDFYDDLIDVLEERFIDDEEETE